MRVGNRAAPALVLGSYPDVESGRLALRRLRRGGFRRAAAACCLPDGRAVIDDNGFSPLLAILVGGLIAIAVVAVYFLLAPTHILPTALGWTAIATLTTAGALAGWLLSRQLGFGVRDSVLDRYRRWVTAGETLVIVQVEVHQSRTVLALLRETEGALPVTFIIRPRSAVLGRVAEFQRQERFSSERLKLHAAWLAGRHAGALRTRRPQPLWNRLRDCERIVDAITLDLVR